MPGRRCWLALCFLPLLAVGPVRSQAPPAPAVPTVTLPAEVRGDASTFLTVPATTSGTEVRWFAPDAGLSLVPPALLRDSRVAVIMAARTGRFRLLAWTAVAGVPSEAAVTWVVIGELPPGPTPVPPGPGPTPVPPPPTPDDPLLAVIRPLYNSDPSPTKAADVKALAGVYRAAPTADPTLATFRDLYANLAAAGSAAVPLSRLAPIRSAIATETAKVLGTDVTAPLTAAGRASARKQFDRVAGCLEALPQ